MGFFPSFSLETWALLVILWALLLLYGIWPFNFFKKLGIPGPRPLPFVGTFLEYRHGIIEFDVKCHQKYGKIWGIFDGRQPVLAVLDPTMIKTILVKEFYTHFTNHRNYGLNGHLEASVFSAPDDKWKRIRTVLSPTFTSGRLKEMMPIILHYGELLVRNIQKRVENNELIDTKAIFGAYSMDVTSSTAFSIDVDTINNPGDPFVKKVQKLCTSSLVNPLLILTAVFPFLVPLLEKLNFTILSSSVMNFFMSIVKKIKHQRQMSKHMGRVDFLQLMVDSQVSGDISDGANSYKALTDEEVLAQAILFIIAGFESTSNALTYLCYSLATHPDVQQKLQEEIDNQLKHAEIGPAKHMGVRYHLLHYLTEKGVIEMIYCHSAERTASIFSTKPLRRDCFHKLRSKKGLQEGLRMQTPPTYDAILQMEYLDMVVNETLRLYPPGVRIDRVCRNTVNIHGVTIPKGTVVIIPAFVLQRLPEYWPEPEEFRPERFSKENKETLDPYTFLPFGAGPRNCIGMRFALLVLKVAVVVLLQKFSFRTCEETPIALELNSQLFVQPKKPIKLKFVPRKAAGLED